MSINDCKIIDIETHQDHFWNRGKLSVFDINTFNIKRIFYIYEVPKDTVRGGHAHKNCEQLLIAIYGGLQVLVKDGNEYKYYILNNPSKALYVPPYTWVEIDGEKDFICLVAASELYSEEDYIRDYSKFLEEVK